MPGHVASTFASPYEDCEGREVWALVHGFLMTLDETRRTVFVASLLEGLSPAETAELTGIGVLTVYHRVRALRRSFKQWLAARQSQP